jgi:hypothetical protein
VLIGLVTKTEFNCRICNQLGEQGKLKLEAILVSIDLLTYFNDRLVISNFMLCLLPCHLAQRLPVIGMGVVIVGGTIFL